MLVHSEFHNMPSHLFHWHSAFGALQNHFLQGSADIRCVVCILRRRGFLAAFSTTPLSALFASCLLRCRLCAGSTLLSSLRAVLRHAHGGIHAVGWHHWKWHLPTFGHCLGVHVWWHAIPLHLLHVLMMRWPHKRHLERRHAAVGRRERRREWVWRLAAVILVPCLRWDANRRWWRRNLRRWVGRSPALTFGRCRSWQRLVSWGKPLWHP
mmetsp:Transcript_44863/g.106439  ORF Transcript_44863/g.106439 Transcript_44863/m.106439 type:complete len:210 (+) Transcript_44863:1385-2014(+)